MDAPISRARAFLGNRPVLLSLCTRVAARIMALVCAALFLWPLIIVSVLDSILLWRAGGAL